MNLGTLIEKTVRRFAERTALRDDDRALTFAKTGERIDRLGTALAGMGYRKGTRVASLQRNSIEAIETDLMAARFGFCRILLNAKSTKEDHLYVLNHCKAEVLVCGNEFAEHVEAMRPDLPNVSLLICVGGQPEGSVSYDSLIAGNDPDPPAWDVTSSDVHSIYYTSGSTGRPKGVVLSQQNWMVNLRNHLLDPYSHSCETDVLLHAAPLSHASGTMVAPHFVRGACQRVISKFSVDLVYDLIEQEKITTVFLAPTMISMMLQADGSENRDTGSLHTVVYGGAPMAAERVREALNRWGPVLMQGYGQWEAPQQSTWLSRADHVRAVNDSRCEGLLASCGRPITFAEVAIMDDAGQLLPTGREGEIVVAGDHLMVEYLDNPEATAEVRVGKWLRTGDVGKLDEHGYLYITDRKKDVIITGGSNVYPREIEEVLYRHPDIGEAIAIGIPDDTWGEKVHVVAAPRRGHVLHENTLLEWCADKFGNDKRPRSVSVLEDLPKSPYGKILRREIREEYWKDRERRI